jgi:tetratricopeptide (TPR) repeat protein/CHAT domain-containing protein
MSRSRSFAVGIFLCALFCLSGLADDAPKKLTDKERSELEGKLADLNEAGVKAFRSGKIPDARKAFEEALEVSRRLYSKDEFPAGHAKLADCIDNLANAFHDLAKFAEAETLYRETLDMRRRLFKGDHRKVAESLNNLALLYSDQRKFASAEPLLREALEMRKRLFSGDHADVALNINNLANLYYRQGKLAEAEKQFREALEMYKRLFKDDHPNLIVALNNLAVVYQSQGKYEEAEPIFRDILERRRRQYKGDHPYLVISLNNLANLCRIQAKYAEAEKLFQEALDMRKRLFKGDHPDTATSFNNLAAVYAAVGRYEEAETLYRDALEMRKRLFKGNNPDVASSLNNLGMLYEAQGKFVEAEKLFLEALEMNRQTFKGDHPSIALSWYTLGDLYRVQGKSADAEKMLRDALEMRKRMYKGDHQDLCLSQSSLAALYLDLGRYTDAEILLRDAHSMSKRIFKGDHPELANCLSNLATLNKDWGNYSLAESLGIEARDMRKRLFKGDHKELVYSLNQLASIYKLQGKLKEAQSLTQDALEMSKRIFKGDHPTIADNMNNLATYYIEQKNFAEAYTLSHEALEMYKRLFKGDNRGVANSMNELGALYLLNGRYADAEKCFRYSLEMNRRLLKGDHYTVARGLNNLATIYQHQGKFSLAESIFRSAFEMRKRLSHGDHLDVAFSLHNLACVNQLAGNLAEAKLYNFEALKMHQRLVQSFATLKTEGEALTFMALLTRTRDDYLSTSRQSMSDPVTIYPEVWISKGLIARVFEQRQLAARFAKADPTTDKLLAELADARCRRAELLLAPNVADPATESKREQDLKTFETKIEELNKTIRPLLPTFKRNEKLANATPVEFQKSLPDGAAVVDFMRYTTLEASKEKPAISVFKRTGRYTAFVLTRDTVTWVDLDLAEPIETAINDWRGEIDSGKEISPKTPDRLRELIWKKVERVLPANIKTLYISPDAALCRLPWAALPGHKPGSILLEDYAIATIPHAQFLLDKLLPQELLKNQASGALAVGGVKYDAEIPKSTSNDFVSRRDPLVKPGAKPGWAFLPGTVGEVNGVLSVAERKKIAATIIDGDKATTSSVLAALPKARYAHFATHGFFADPSFRGIFQLDEKDYEKSQSGERIGRAAKSPLVMTGLVLAGANDPKTPGRGIITGESLIDLDLSGLQLAVLSACETGLGDVAGGEGTFGLQRAFHMAGTRNVIASLWKVPDQSTAALMALFYQNLWDKNLSPMESLRQAQLEIHHHPEKIPDLAKGFRGPFKEVLGANDGAEITPSKAGKAHPRMWAAFSLSGPGL